jgi:hypothetical protein
MYVTFSWFILQFISYITVFIFCLLILSIMESRVLKSPTMVIEMSVSPFNSVSYFSICFRALYTVVSFFHSVLCCSSTGASLGTWCPPPILETIGNSIWDLWLIFPIWLEIWSWSLHLVFTPSCHSALIASRLLIVLWFSAMLWSINCSTVWSK